MIIAMLLSGFLFLFIFVLQLAMAAFGYILEPTPKHYDSDAVLQKINKDPKKFQISIVLALIEHGCVITLAILLFIVFSPYYLILGIVLVIFRIGEGSIQVYIEKDYWGLLDIARQYSGTSGDEKNSLFDSYRTILQTKSNRFAFVMLCWSIGTLAFSIMLVTFVVVHPIIGWIGIVASIFVGFGNGIKLVKPTSKVFETLNTIGGLSAILFEVIIGGWLIFLSLIIL
ncbi:MAG: DUF4386 domain-containing protein [Candidatus Hermodarchaeota archaeon]|nr:DUF4386 domain-containing protein [Candidatus Hermodarchaeota archaeon]